MLQNNSAKIEEHLRFECVLQNISHTFAGEKTRIAFCGCFKSGKSSLINAVLGVDLLPTQTTTATAVITRVFYSKSPCAYAMVSGVKKEISFDQIADYIMVKEKTLDGIALPKASEVGVGIPHKLLKCVEFVDTPGLEDDKELTRIALEEVHRTDLAIIVYNAVQFMSKDEKDTARKINKLLDGNVVFVVNRIDLLSGNNAIDDIRKSAKYYLGGLGGDLTGKGSIFYTVAGGNKKDVTTFASRLNQIIGDNDLLAQIRSKSRDSLMKHYRDEKLDSLNYDIEDQKRKIKVLETKDSHSISEKASAEKIKFRNLRVRLTELNVKVSTMMTAHCANECLRAFNLLKSQSGSQWYLNYGEETKKKAMEIFEEYVTKEIIDKLKDVFNSGHGPNLSNAFSGITFPKAFKNEYREKIGGKILGGLAFLGGVALCFTGGGAAIGVPMMMGGAHATAADGERECVTIVDHDCVSKSIQFIKDVVSPAVLKEIESYLDMQSGKIRELESSLVVNGEYDNEIDVMKKDLTQLKSIRKRMNTIAIKPF